VIERIAMENLTAAIGLPYARAHGDGTVTCPVCSVRIGGIDESQRTAEDATTKGAAARYAEHHKEQHT
jgi:uncharacterized Zn finger protein (UPF0148 family)